MILSITTADGKACEGLEQAPFEPIAVIGMAALMPEATSIEQFWQNIIDSHVSIKEVTKDRWDSEIYWRPGGPGNIEEGKTYCKIGGFVEGYEFEVIKGLEEYLSDPNLRLIGIELHFELLKLRGIEYAPLSIEKTLVESGFKEIFQILGIE